MAEIHRFTLTDRRGKSHDYEVTLHPAEEGLDILAAFAQYGLGAGFGRLDLSKLLPLRKLTRDILEFTTRDKLELRANGAFDDAYRANFGELIRALAEVVEVNDFLPLPAGIKSDVRAMLASGLQVLTAMRSTLASKATPTPAASSASTGSSGGPPSPVTCR